MKNIIVVGTQWGDEGKGKLVDLLAPNFDVAASLRRAQLQPIDAPQFRQR